jgi:hypothetical protein
MLALLQRLAKEYTGLDEHFKHSLHPADLKAIRAVIAKASQ